MTKGTGAVGEDAPQLHVNTTGDFDLDAVPPLIGVISKVAGVITGCLMVGILAVILLQVVMRYWVKNPLTWADEATRLQLVWLAFLGAVLAYRVGSHIAVDALEGFARSRGWTALGRSAAVVVESAILLSSVIFVVGGVQLVQATAGRHTPALGISVAWSYGAIPICGALVLVSAVEKLLRLRSSREVSS